LLLIVPILVVRALLGAWAQQSSCERCHDEIAKAEGGLMHARAGIDCATCHGGDPTKDTREAAESLAAGFRGKLTPVGIVSLCGDCHSDVRRMNPYGLPTDQLAQYRTSRHGEALFDRGDERVATCASCHGAHGILGPTSSESPVFPANVPQTCGRCHADASLMKDYQLDPAIPENYRRGVHGSQLLDKGDHSAPQCATCHGSHGAVPPGFRTVGAVCGKCHLRERELFEHSPHAPLVEDEAFPGCEACHGNHAIAPATPALLERRTCGLCHAVGEETLGQRDRIVKSLRGPGELLAATAVELEAAAQQGLVTNDDRFLLEQARTILRQTRVQQHQLDAGSLEQSANEARKELAEISNRLEQERRREQIKRLAVLPVVGFLLLMSTGFWLRFRRIHHKT
jgi:hypothetical protein